MDTNKQVAVTLPEEHQYFNVENEKPSHEPTNLSKEQQYLNVANEKPSPEPTTLSEEHQYLNVENKKPSQESTALLEEHQDLNGVNEKPPYEPTTVQTIPAPKLTTIESIVALIIFLLVAAIPILQLYIGRRYADDCPINWHIPHYLIVAGVGGIFIIILGIIQNIFAIKVSSDRTEQNKKSFSGLMFLCIAFLLVTFIFFLFIWLIAGCYWIFRAWNNVQYKDSTRNNYCHPTLYRFAFWSIIVVLILKMLSCCHSSSKIFGALKKRGTTTTQKPIEQL